MMSRIKVNFRGLILFILVVSLSGCALTNWSPLRKVEYKDGARRFTAEVPAGWMKFNLVNYFVMTRDGIVLEKIAVERRKFTQDLEFTKKKFSADMTPQELAEIEIDNLKANGKIDRVEIASNKPASIDGRSAFRLEYSFFAEGGLKVRGTRYGFTEGDFIYRVYYEAADQHYYDMYIQDFERFIKSFKLFSNLNSSVPAP